MGLEYQVKRVSLSFCARVAVFAAVPFLSVASAGQAERGVDPAMAEAIKRCEAALATHRDAETTPPACAEAVSWRLYPKSSKRIRPILILRQSLLA